MGRELAFRELDADFLCVHHSHYSPLLVPPAFNTIRSTITLAHAYHSNNAKSVEDRRFDCGLIVYTDVQLTPDPGNSQVMPQASVSDSCPRLAKVNQLDLFQRAIPLRRLSCSLNCPVHAGANSSSRRHRVWKGRGNPVEVEAKARTCIRVLRNSTAADNRVSWSSSSGALGPGLGL